VSNAAAGPAALELVEVGHAFGETIAVDRFQLTVGAGELVCLLGPSGCGKSTVLRLAAGLEPLQRGRVLMQGRVVADASSRLAVPPEARGVGLMFQDFALFPHLTVAGNVGFGLGGLTASEKAVRVRAALDQVDMLDYSESYPHSLSGGEQQRVALARALAPRPSLMLLDEPFSGLDARLRDQIRDDTLHLLKRSSTAALLVTHDPEEAMFMADRIYLMQDGRIVQSGTPSELYRRPKNAFVAQFFSAANAFDLKVANGCLATPLGAFPAGNLKEGEAVRVLIRPELIAVKPLNGGGIAPEAVVAIVEEARFIGSAVLLKVSLATPQGGSIGLKVRLAGRSMPEIGARLALCVGPADLLVFPAGRDEKDGPADENRPRSGA
jgi:iron(III) transport system ATP-binding protein